MSLLSRLKTKVNRYNSVAEREKRKLAHAQRVTDKLITQAGQAKLQTRRAEIRAELSEAKTKLAIAKAKEREAEARKKKAEREVWEERTRKIGAIVGTFTGAGIRQAKTTRKRRRSKR